MCACVVCVCVCVRGSSSSSSAAAAAAAAAVALAAPAPAPAPAAYFVHDILFLTQVPQNHTASLLISPKHITEIALKTFYNVFCDIYCEINQSSVVLYVSALSVEVRIQCKSNVRRE